MELSQEYLDKALANLQSNILQQVDRIVDEKLEKLHTRITKEYQEFVIQAFEAHQIWVEEHFKHWIVPYDVRVRVARLETKID